MAVVDTWQTLVILCLTLNTKVTTAFKFQDFLASIEKGNAIVRPYRLNSFDDLFWIADSQTSSSISKAALNCVNPQVHEGWDRGSVRGLGGSSYQTNVFRQIYAQEPSSEKEDSQPFSRSWNISNQWANCCISRKRPMCVLKCGSQKTRLLKGDEAGKQI